jgi:hypothetical protein
MPDGSNDLMLLIEFSAMMQKGIQSLRLERLDGKTAKDRHRKRQDATRLSSSSYRFDWAQFRF